MPVRELKNNQMGIRAHCQPGDELLINESGHIANFEGGIRRQSAASRSARSLHRTDFLDMDVLEGRIRVNDQHYPRTRLVCLENLTNIGGGHIYPLEHLQRVSRMGNIQWSEATPLAARLFNAIVAGVFSR